MKNMNYALKLVSLFALIAWMTVIFILSSQPAAVSNSNSKAATKSIIKAVEGENKSTTSVTTVNRMNDLFREYAHSAVYFILAVIFSFVLALYRFRGRKIIFCVLAFCLLYAISDEFHQLFVPGRAFQLIDLGMDMIGSVLSLTSYYISAKAALRV